MTLEEKRLLSCREAANFLGISESALRKRIFLRQIKGLCRIGGRIYFDRLKLESFIGEIAIDSNGGVEK